LKSWFNPNPSRLFENYDSGSGSIVEMADIALNFIDALKELETLEEAYVYPILEQRMKWMNAIRKSLTK
jgi:hypothetical protein